MQHAALEGLQQTQQASLQPWAGADDLNCFDFAGHHFQFSGWWVRLGNDAAVDVTIGEQPGAQGRGTEVEAGLWVGGGAAVGQDPRQLSGAVGIEAPQARQVCGGARHGWLDRGWHLRPGWGGRNGERSLLIGPRQANGARLQRRRHQLGQQGQHLKQRDVVTAGIVTRGCR